MRLRKTAVVLGAVAVLTSAVAATAASASDGSQSALAATREATDKYHDVAVAEADGYVFFEGDECVPQMGMHYVNFAQFGQMDPLQPDALLYEPSDDGPRLVGAEWIVIDDDQDLSTVNDPVPSMFGQTFDGPMEGHGPGMPIHYDLHAYIWKGNPDGVFATWNRNVRC